MLMFYTRRLEVKIKGYLSLHTKAASRKGTVLLSYITAPFLIPPTQEAFQRHTNYWECTDIASIFLDEGYDVDVVDWNQYQFLPKKPYRMVIDIHGNLPRFAPFLPAECVKVFHITGAHWLYMNHAEYTRLNELQERRGVTLFPRRQVPPSLNIESADCGTSLGNDFTFNTYAFSGKTIHPIPISTTHTFDFPEAKDFGQARKKFLWFGGGGLVHKGLDLVLEAFATLPEVELHVCGPIKKEADFEQFFSRELYETSNIHTHGWLDMGGREFKQLVDTCAYIIYPSCSEGGGGSVVSCMHAGLIPLVTPETSISLGTFGTLLEDISVDGLQSVIRTASERNAKDVSSQSRAAWEFARRHHTRDTFHKAFRAFVQKTLSHE